MNKQSKQKPNKDNPSPDLNNKAGFMDRIMESKPKSKNWFNTLSIIKTVLILVLILFSSYLIAIWFFDVLESLVYAKVYYWYQTPFVFLIFLAVGISLFVWIYRSSDWPLVRHAGLLTVFFIVLSLIFGASFAFSGHSLDSDQSRQILHEGREIYKNMPGSNKLEKLRKLREKREESGGIIREILATPRGRIIILKEYRTNKTERFFLPRINNSELKKNDRVKIKYLNTKEGKVITSIKKIEPLWKPGF